MRTTRRLPLTLLAAAVPAAFANAGYAAEENVEAEGPTARELATPTSHAEAGVGYVSDAARRFGEYNGLKDAQLYPLIDLEYRRRLDETGTWIGLRARNLGLETREIRFDHNRQGNWGYFVEYTQTPRFEPYTAVTGLGGIGTNAQIVNGTAPRPVELGTRRDTWSIGGDKFFAGVFEVNLRFRNEDKNGSRLYGQGDNPGAPTTRFLVDPIDYKIRQWEAIASYNGRRMQFSLGYYGLSFDNQNPALTLTGTPAPIFTPVALPPANRSHQMYLNGGYNFTPTMRTNFKVAYSRATQDEGFIVPSVPGVANLDARVDTLFANVGFTAQPLPALSVLANFRYDDRDDKTPVRTYFTGFGTASTLSGENEPRSIRTIGGKFEAAYALPWWGLRALAGVDYEEKHRNFFQVRSVSHRDKTDEISYRAEVRRPIGETLTGALAYIRSDRDGSDFRTTTLAGGGAGSNLIAPLHLADRTRDKVRASLTWMVTDPLTIQFAVDEGRDRYAPRTAADIGVREGRMHLASVDASYVFSTAWTGTAWWTMNDVRQVQSSLSGATQWIANLGNSSDTVGVGLHGKPWPKIDLGADLLYSRIIDDFGVSTASGPTAASQIPRIRTTMTRATLFAKYAVQKNMGFRLNYIYDRWHTNDWTWADFVYTDGTRLVQDNSQKIHFIGITAYYRFR
ncbi:MAG TPA: MtrB/PioB family decaheme-associated outer membrane protein [Burkholderiales bacterium]|nr:MtrB/PioB family decaheme-associated outer membrane protein [Burkholderiales bacterium]